MPNQAVPHESATQSVQPQELDHPSVNGNVAFHWDKDRFSHIVRLKDREISSDPGGESDDWPNSPPIQQLSIESIDGRDVALGVGCAGTSHFSCSIEPTETGFRFDWACRAKQEPVHLGSSYLGTGAFEIRPEESATARASGSSFRITPAQSLCGAGTYCWSYEIRLSLPQS